MVFEKPPCETCDSSIGAEKHDEPHYVPENTFQIIVLKTKRAKKMTPTMLEKWRAQRSKTSKATNWHMASEMTIIPWLGTEPTPMALTSKAHALSSYATEVAHSCHQTIVTFKPKRCQ